MAAKIDPMLLARALDPQMMMLLASLVPSGPAGRRTGNYATDDADYHAFMDRLTNGINTPRQDPYVPFVDEASKKFIYKK